MALNAPALPASSVPPLRRAAEGVRAGQRPGAAAGFRENAEAAILGCRAYRGRVKSRIRGAAEPQRVGAAERHHIAGDGRARPQFQRIGAAGEGDGKAAGAAGDRPAIDDSDVRARDSGAADTTKAIGTIDEPRSAKSARAGRTAGDRAGVCQGPAIDHQHARTAVAAITTLAGNVVYGVAGAAAGTAVAALNRCPRVIGEVRATG